MLPDRLLALVEVDLIVCNTNWFRIFYGYLPLTGVSNVLKKLALLNIHCDGTLERERDDSIDLIVYARLRVIRPKNKIIIGMRK